MAIALASAMGDTFHEIIISKGFKISGPYETFDDITYGDKKAAHQENEDLAS